MTKGSLEENEPRSRPRASKTPVAAPRGFRIGRRGPQKIGDVVAELLARRGYAQVQQAEAFALAWTQAAGKFAAHSRAGNNRGGVLEVVVRNSTVVQEMTFQKRKLVSQLATLLPDQKIRDLKFKVGSID